MIKFCCHCFWRIFCRAVVPAQPPFPGHETLLNESGCWVGLGARDTINSIFQNWRIFMQMMLIFLVILIPMDILAEVQVIPFRNNLIEYALSNPANENSSSVDSTKKFIKQIKGYRHPFIGLLVAVGPGIILRGIGHCYAGSYKMGTCLLAVSLLGMHLTRHDAGASLMVWITTWAYDIIATPFLCMDHNRAIQKKVTIHPFATQHLTLGKQVGIRINYNF